MTESWLDEKWAATTRGAASVILVRGQRILLLKRGPTAPWMPGKWNLPGGVIEEGESSKDGATRECEEEAGVTPRNLRRLERGIRVEIFWTDEFSGEPNFNWESTDMEWVYPNEAIKMDVVPGIRDAIKELGEILAPESVE